MEKKMSPLTVRSLAEKFRRIEDGLFYIDGSVLKKAHRSGAAIQLL